MKSFSCLTALVAVLLFLVSSPSAHAQGQTSIYGTAAVTDFVFFQNGTNSAKSDTGGFIAGAFYNFPIDSRLTAGIDARVSYGFGYRGGTTVTAALRIGFVPRVVPLRPYFELGGGVATTTRTSGQIAGLSTTRYTSGGLQLAIGLDVRITNSIDIRAFELGAIAPSSNSNNITVGSGYLDAGIVYHFHKS